MDSPPPIFALHGPVVMLVCLDKSSTRSKALDALSQATSSTPTQSVDTDFCILPIWFISFLTEQLSRTQNPLLPNTLGLLYTHIPLSPARFGLNYLKEASNSQREWSNPDSLAQCSAFLLVLFLNKGCSKCWAC